MQLDGLIYLMKWPLALIFECAALLGMFHSQITRLKFKSLIFCNFPPMSAGPDYTLEFNRFLDYLLFAKFRISLNNLLSFEIELLFFHHSKLNSPVHKKEPVIELVQCPFALTSSNCN